MPEEMRCILFGPDELRALIGDFMNVRAGGKTGAEIGQVTLRKNKAGVSVGFLRGTGAKSMSQLDAPDLLAAAVLFCQKRRIPLPMKATKVLQVSDDKLVLAITKPRVT